MRELGQGARAELTQREGHGAGGGQRGERRDERDHPEEDPGDVIEQVEHRPAVFAEAVEREPEEHRDEQHLQEVAVDEGRDERAGNEM